MKVDIREVKEIVKDYKQGQSRFGVSVGLIGYDLSEELSDSIYLILRKMLKDYEESRGEDLSQREECSQRQL